MVEKGLKRSEYSDDAKNKDIKSKRNFASVLLKWLMIIIVSILLVLMAFIGILSLTEYKPEEIEQLEITGSSQIKASTNVPYNVLTYNIGYAALDAENDFFMDGGSGVLARSKQDVETNLENIASIIQDNSADIIFLQEIDVNSKRSFNINEYEYIKETSGGVSALAYNYRCDYIPYPLPTLGKVNSGISTISSFYTSSAERISLPVPFSWPLRICNLKRCLLVERIPVEGSDKELVLINLHLEAYDDGEGKIAQTAVLVSLLEDEYKKGNYVIAGGDFNQTFPNVDMGNDSLYRIVDDSYWQPGALSPDMLSEGWQILCDDAVPTCRLLNAPYDATQATQYYVIDGFIVSPNIKVNTINTLNTEFKYTDHNPVFMNITLTEDFN